MIYYATLTLFSLVGYFDLAKKNAQQKAVLFALFLLLLWFLALFAGSRENVGVDYDAYKNIYYKYDSMKDLRFTRLGSNIEPGIIWLNRFLKSTGAGSEVSFLLISIITISLIGLSIKEYTPLIFSSLLAYFCLYYLGNEFGKIRAGMACGFTLFSLRYVLKEKFLLFMLYVSLAVLFHRSAIIALPVYFFAKREISKSKLYFILMVFMIIGLSGVVNIVLQQTFLGNKYSGNLTIIHFFLSKAQGYLTKSGGSFIESSMMTYVRVLLKVILCVALIIYRDKLKKTTPYFTILFMSFFYSTVLSLLLIDFGIFAVRGVVPLAITQVILIPLMIFCREPLFDRLVLYVLVVVYVAVRFYYSNIYFYSDRFIPYRSVLW